MTNNLNTPAIVIVAFNRPDSLSRLLRSIAKADYPSALIPLCFCIDYQDSATNKEVLSIAESFEWAYGPKEVVHQQFNLGLKAHVLKSGDLTEKYDAIIMLEDDLYVSPAFYNFSVMSLNNYHAVDEIAGISLYTHRMNIIDRLPFEPLNDGTDVFYLQIASSWGQVWSKRQWFDFRSWLKKNPKLSDESRIPISIQRWPDKSWLKHFIGYLVDKKKYFVYPRTSLSTNFGEAGENTQFGKPYFQVPLLTTNKVFTFSEFNTADPIYDCYFEVLPSTIKKRNNLISKLHFAVNLNGLKPLATISEPYVLMIGKSASAKASFGLMLKPIDANVLENIEGDQLVLVDKSFAERANRGTSVQRKYLFEYRYGLIPMKVKFKNFIDVLLAKLKS